MSYKYLGKEYNRPDAINKVTGQAVYLDDVRSTRYAARCHPASGICARKDIEN